MTTHSIARDSAMFDPLITLAALSDQDRAEIFFWAGVIVVIGVFMAIGGLLLYRYLRKAGEPDPETAQAGFSLAEMRRLYEAGEISHEEYMQVKERVLAAAKKTMLGDESMSQVTPTQKPTPTPPPGLPPEIDTTPVELDENAGEPPDQPPTDRKIGEGPKEGPGEKNDPPS